MGSQGFGSSFFVAVVMKIFLPIEMRGGGFVLPDFSDRRKITGNLELGTWSRKLWGVPWESRRLII